jgi:hypothetical protein
MVDPLESVIVPRTRPPVLCALANGAIIKHITPNKIVEEILRQQTDLT